MILLIHITNKLKKNSFYMFEEKKFEFSKLTFWKKLGNIFHIRAWIIEYLFVFSLYVWLFCDFTV